MTEGMEATEVYKILSPPKPEWEWCIGGDSYSMSVQVVKGPHWLGRLLQRIFLDIHWRKIK